MGGAVPKGVGLDKGLLVAYDKSGGDGGKDANLIEGIFLFLLGEVVHLDFLEGVDVGVGNSLHLVDRRVGSLS